MALENAQSKQLWRNLLGRYAGFVMLWTALCIGGVLLLEQYVFPTLGERIASSTSMWMGITEQELDNLTTSLGVDALYGNYDRIPRYQVTTGYDGAMLVRNLEFYESLRQLKLPLFFAVYLIGVLVISVVVLRRSVRDFDKLALAVTGLAKERTAAPKLPANLYIIQAELLQIQSDAIAAEMASAEEERRKNEMVAYLAHDIRSPLTSVTGYLELLKESPDMPLEAREHYASVAFSKACRMEGLVNEFFEITRYNVVRMPIERERLDAALFCQQVAEGFDIQAAARNLTIEVDAPEDLEFLGDPDKLSRALGNVIRNAIAFADPGTVIQVAAMRVASLGAQEPLVTVEGAAVLPAAPSAASRVSAPPPGASDAPAVPPVPSAFAMVPHPVSAAIAPRGQYVRFTVTDQGKEISKLHLTSIFDKFFREDSSRGQENGGAGLGLAIAKEIVQAHKGEITAASDQGLTTFTITLPIG